MGWPGVEPGDARLRRVTDVCSAFDEKLVLEIFPSRVLRNWEQLAPVTAILRRGIGDGLWENFEYLTVLAQDWLAAQPKGTYPAGVRRIQLKDEWLEADKQYAASLAPA